MRMAVAQEVATRVVVVQEVETRVAVAEEAMRAAVEVDAMVLAMRAVPTVEMRAAEKAAKTAAAAMEVMGKGSASTGK